ncbi:hypothetical protein IFM60648_09203 [Aspergillus lentulus]|uniref:Uncharacterized protein n=1 Tax=Aspergillus lentulus TaxID=293939 RepID=A0ABQ1AZX7_ASPLE|nr:hypothetical protein IFM60648_09203 [Aspergillus lentulus]
MFLDAISVSYVTIRAQMGEAARREAAAEFADTRSSCRILLTSYQCGAHGLNLHAECGGTRPSQKVWSIFQEHTISRWLECNNPLKALPLFSAQLHDLLKSMVMAAQAKDDGEDEEAADQAEAEVIQGAVVDCLRRMLGQMTLAYRS